MSSVGNRLRQLEELQAQVLHDDIPTVMKEFPEVVETCSGSGTVRVTRLCRTRWPQPPGFHVYHRDAKQNIVLHAECRGHVVRVESECTLGTGDDSYEYRYVTLNLHFDGDVAAYRAEDFYTGWDESGQGILDSAATAWGFSRADFTALCFIAGASPDGVEQLWKGELSDDEESPKGGSERGQGGESSEEHGGQDGEDSKENAPDD